MPIFVTDTGIEVPAVTADQMREIDRIALDERGPNLFQMMEHAGRSLAALAMHQLGDAWRRSEVVVLAGPGGNGGGGMCAARHLANRGVRVTLCLSRPETLGDVPAFQRKVFHSTPGGEVEPQDLEPIHPALILDALIGYSLQGAPYGLTLELIRWANGTGSPILSLDIPSGLEATTGAPTGEVIAPAWTLTLALPKTGLLPEKTGALYLADIGIPAAVYHKAGIRYESPFDERFTVPLTIREGDSTTRDGGHR